jgi:protein tyrosine/serine phosphatase
MLMPAWLRWTLGVSIAALIFVAPFVYFRYAYTYGKRFREVAPGRLYRSGQMTAEGFTEFIQKEHIKTVINLQDEYDDPDIDLHFLGKGQIKESELCQRLGARYLYMPPDLISRRSPPGVRPQTIDRFLAIMDDPANYPVLIHCRAGLHRTGVLAAVYRMEYDGWSPQKAIAELKAIGFGEFACQYDNDYIREYILTYQPGVRHPPADHHVAAVPPAASEGEK